MSLVGQIAALITELGAQLKARAPLASPTFTGVPAAPTATAGTNTTQLATTAFVTTAAAAKQPLDTDLTAIAALTPTTDNVIQSVSGAWASRTMAQLKTALALTKSDVGLANAANTADADKPISSATQTALDAKQALDADLTTIAGLSATTGNVLQSVAGAWASRTPAQLLATLLTRIGTTASSATPTPDADSVDQYNVTLLAANAVLGAPTGTPADGQRLIMRIHPDATPRTLGYNAIYRALGVVLPTTTVASKTLYLGMIYNAADSKWDVLAVAQEA